MMDFLKANPHVTREDYLWKWTIPQIKLASYDSTRIEYSKSKKTKDKKGKGGNNRPDVSKENTVRLDSLESVQNWVKKNGEKANM